MVVSCLRGEFLVVSCLNGPRIQSSFNFPGNFLSIEWLLSLSLSSLQHKIFIKFITGFTRKESLWKTSEFMAIKTAV